MATATTPRVDWTLIWAQRGFRYFSTAMFVSLFGSGMELRRRQLVHHGGHALDSEEISLQVTSTSSRFQAFSFRFSAACSLTAFDRRYLGVCLDLARGLLRIS